MKKTIASMAVGVALVSAAQAAVIGVNFGSERQTGATDPYTTAGGATVTAWNYEATSDWSGNGTTFLANGVSVGIWHDAKNTWEISGAPGTSVMKGYLDDGATNENYIHLTGLTGWLAATGDTHYKVTVLRSTDNGTGFTSIDITTGNVSGESGWLDNSTPSGGGVTTGDTFAAVTLGGLAEYTYETEAYHADANGFAMHYERDPTDGGVVTGRRATISGVVIESYKVPEPSSAALLGLGGLAMILRRRK